jgi:hypothetical protein
MRPSNETIQSVKRKFGDAIGRLFRVSPDALTAPEAEFLDRFQTFDAFRDRLAATGQEGRERLSSAGLSKQDGVAPESRGNCLGATEGGGYRHAAQRSHQREAGVVSPAMPECHFAKQISPVSKLFHFQEHGQRPLKLAVKVRFVAV